MKWDIKLIKLYINTKTHSRLLQLWYSYYIYWLFFLFFCSVELLDKCEKWVKWSIVFNKNVGVIIAVMHSKYLNYLNLKFKPLHLFG